MAQAAKKKAGRQTGSENKRTIALRNLQVTALREGLTPVDIMLKASYCAHDDAMRVKVTEAELNEHAQGFTETKPDTSKLSKKDADKALEEFDKAKARFNRINSKVSYRRKLLHEAADLSNMAAPFLQPKLSSIMHTEDPDNESPEGFETMVESLNQLAASVAALADKK